MKHGLCILILPLFVIGCEAGLLQLRSPLGNEGEVYLYLEPFPQEAARLRFTVDAISAISGDGRELPLSVSLRELQSSDVNRQRLLAAGVLPAGEYSGFSIRTKSAFVKGEGGESALLILDAPAKNDFRFVVERQRGYVLSLSLKYAEAVDAGFSFSPAFSIYYPDRPPVNLMAFVANSRSNDITVFDKKSRRAFAVIPTSSAPFGMALEQRSRTGYVALPDEDSVGIIDAVGGNISDEIRLAPGDRPVEIALTPDGQTLLSANIGSNTVSVIDARSRFERTKINVATGPRSLAVDRAGRRAFIFNTPSNSIGVIDIRSGSLIGSIQTEPGPVRGEFNRSGDKLFVIHELSSYVTVVNPLTLSVTGRFRIRSPMEAIKVDPNSGLVYLGAKRDFVVGVYDPFSFAPIDVVDTATGIVQMATDADLNNLYMAGLEANQVLIADRIKKRIVGAIDVGNGPCWVVLFGEN